MYAGWDPRESLQAIMNSETSSDQTQMTLIRIWIWSCPQWSATELQTGTCHFALGIQ